MISFQLIVFSVVILILVLIIALEFRVIYSLARAVSIRAKEKGIPDFGKPFNLIKTIRSL